MRKIFKISPLVHGIGGATDERHIPPGYAGATTKNVYIENGRAKKRWGYSQHRTLGEQVYEIILFEIADGTRYTCYLTAENFCVKQTGANDTFSYRTPCLVYDTSVPSKTDDNAVEGIVDDTVYCDSARTLQTDGAAVGDYFILIDDIVDGTLYDEREVNSDWGKISNFTHQYQFDLTANYSGTTSAASDTWDGSEKACLIRQVYSVPSNERWSWCIVNHKLVFTNGNEDVQYWDGSSHAAALDLANAKNARYCIEYADRLILADLTVSGARSPCTIRYSANGDITDWTDSTAGDIDLLDTQDRITGLGVVGSTLVVFKTDEIYFGNRTGTAASPIAFPSRRGGVGCIAPYSIAHVKGTVAFLGRDNFYILNGTQPVPIGNQIRELFFDSVPYANLENVWSGVNQITQEVLFFATETSGQAVYVWNYGNNQWTKYDFNDTITAFGMGVNT